MQRTLLPDSQSSALTCHWEVFKHLHQLPAGSIKRGKAEIGVASVAPLAPFMNPMPVYDPHFVIYVEIERDSSSLLELCGLPSQAVSSSRPLVASRTLPSLTPLPTYSLLFGPSFKTAPNLALIKCFSTLPEALVGRAHRWATIALGSLKPARPWRRQKSCRSAAESLSVKGEALVLALAECGKTRSQSALS